jgi:nitroreductase
MSPTSREPAFSVDPQFIERWSPRAFTGEAIPEEALMSMLEAARWSPSANNSQPWRFSYARKGEAAWDRFLDFLMDSNRAWAREAGALVIVISKTQYVTASHAEPRFTRTHSFDTGAAALAFQLQAMKLGFHAHPMGGIHQDKIRADLGLPDEGFVIEAAIAVGRKAEADTLPEKLKEREVPSARMAIADFAFNGTFDPKT